MRFFKYQLLCAMLCGAATSCDSALPQKEQVVGDCFVAADCGATAQVCKENQCVACGAQSDCDSQVCDTYGDLGGAGRGTCVAASSIVYVDNGESNQLNCSQAKGTLALPYCTLAEALTASRMPSGPNKLIRLLASSSGYFAGPFTMDAGAVVLLGPASSEAGKAATLLADTDDSKIIFGQNSNVLIDGIVLSAEGISGAAGSKITIRRAVMNSMGSGQSFDTATVTLDRNLIAEGSSTLAFANSVISVTNNIIANNTLPQDAKLISISGGSGTFQFNSVVYNSLMGNALALSCADSTAVTVKNSIFAQNGVTPQISASGCKLTASSVVVGKSDPTAGQIKQEPVFEDPLKLDLRPKLSDPTSAQYIIDKAVEVSAASDKNIDHDYLGTARPQGGGYDIGAFELPVK